MAFVEMTSGPTVEVDRINVGLALVNWCVLLLLLCGLLLAKTLPSDTRLTSGLGGEDCTTATCSVTTAK
ncbi:MAG: hypothetical protein ACT4QG_01005 [Sporichthyaceae bacterium]